MLESQKLPVIVNAALCWAWLAVYSLLERTVLSSSANLNLGDISTVSFWSYAHCPWANKSHSVQLARLRHGLLASFEARGVQRLELYD